MPHTPAHEKSQSEIPFPAEIVLEEGQPQFSIGDDERVDDRHIPVGQLALEATTSDGEKQLTKNIEIQAETSLDFPVTDGIRMREDVLPSNRIALACHAYLWLA